MDYLPPESAAALGRVNRHLHANESLQLNLKVLNLMHDAKALVSSNVTDVQEKIELLCKIGSTLAKLGDTDLTGSTFDQASRQAAESRSPVENLCTIATSQSKAKLSDAAKRTFQQAKNHADGSDNDNDLFTVATAMAKAKFFDEALDIATNLPAESNSTKSELFSTFGALHGKSGHVSAAKAAFTEALTVAQAIPDRLIQDECRRAIVRDQISAGFLDEAEKTAQAIGTDVDKISRLHAFLEVAVAYAKAGDIDYAGYIATNKIAGARSDYCPSLLGEIAVAQVSGGGIKQAETTLNMSKAFFDRIGGRADQGSRYRDYNHVLKGYIPELITRGELDKAKLGIKQYQCSVDEKSELLIKIAANQAQSGLTEQAEETFSEVSEIANEDTLPPYLRERILMNTISAQADAGLFQSAIATANHYGDGGSFKKCQALGVVAGKQAKAGFREQALATFEAALAEADPSTPRDVLEGAFVDTDFLKGDFLEDVAIKQADAGFIEQATTTANRINSSYHKINVLLRIATAWAHEGQEGKAIATFEQAEQLIKNIEVVLGPWAEKMKLAQAQAKAGFFREAIQTVNTISGEPYKPLASRAVLDAQFQEVERIFEHNLVENPPEP